MSLQPFKIKIPGSTSNLGPGFDSVGLAVNRFLHVEVQPSEEWHIECHHPDGKLPGTKDNLVLQTAESICKKYNVDLPSLNIFMSSDIPLARGLGSSAAAIVAGIEIADAVGDLALTLEEKAHLASTIEGHPDNATASYYGGLTISHHTNETTETLACRAPEVEIIAMIPDSELPTKKARGILPKDLPFETAIKGSSISNMLVAALLLKDWELAGRMMEKDLFHHPYRKELVPDLSRVTAFCSNNGAIGAALSGAGPTIICFAKKDDGERITRLLADEFPNYQYQYLSPAVTGAIRYSEPIQNMS
ncbi:homoserine kinase [Scopulibacillus darangshiensis]|uniref:Homoserine kinase n=1 Tax=Scopulibacillus darangshiensis TaxID=442528 RepID=A0A4R2P2J0_9BACL|nr:homoserine kinase [Scopulibacillus darangshiensis]TCP28933.1 homoserine kinase [Scopulibacillus darangshiensis]